MDSARLEVCQNQVYYDFTDHFPSKLKEPEKVVRDSCRFLGTPCSRLPSGELARSPYSHLRQWRCVQLLMFSLTFIPPPHTHTKMHFQRTQCVRRDKWPGVRRPETTAVLSTTTHQTTCIQALALRPCLSQPCPTQLTFKQRKIYCFMFRRLRRWNMIRMELFSVCVFYNTLLFRRDQRFGRPYQSSLFYPVHTALIESS